MKKIAPEFAQEDWYWDPTDHSCPHDAWLNRMEISEPASGSRNEIRVTQIVVELLGAYHDGIIRLTYANVLRHLLSAQNSSGGLGDWLSDDFTSGPDNIWTHRIVWERGLWCIEAGAIRYDWIPHKA